MYIAQPMVFNKRSINLYFNYFILFPNISTVQISKHTKGTNKLQQQQFPMVFSSPFLLDNSYAIIFSSLCTQCFTLPAMQTTTRNTTNNEWNQLNLRRKSGNNWKCNEKIVGHFLNFNKIFQCSTRYLLIFAIL